jgi:hypothetical protein
MKKAKFSKVWKLRSKKKILEFEFGWSVLANGIKIPIFH